MPYQVRKGSLNIMAADAAAALMIFDSMDKDGEPVTICDAGGQQVDPEAIPTLLRQALRAKK
jgi:hypothetical protein